MHHRPIKESFFDDDLWNSMEVYEFHGFQGSHGNPWMTWNFMDAMEFHGISWNYMQSMESHGIYENTWNCIDSVGTF